jgi:hypothetical protein
VDTDQGSEGRTGSEARGLDPSIRVLVLAFVLIAAGVAAIRSFPAVDLWWQLAAGRLIAEGHGIPHTDPFSYTAGGQPWVAHEWLACLALYRMSEMWGILSIGLAKCLASVAIAALLFRAALLRSRSWPLAGALVLFGFVSMRPYLGPRPLMLTLLFSALLLNLGAFGSGEPRGGRRWWRLGLPVLFLVWANCHLGFIFGLVLLAAAAVDESVSGRAAPATWLLLWAGCAAVTLANPYGWHLHATAVRIVTNATAMSSVVEWLSPDFHQQYNLPFLLLLVTGAAAATHGWRRRAGLTVLTLLLAAASLRAMRNVALFSLVAPLGIADALGRVRIGHERALAAVVIGAAAVVIGLHAGSVARTGLEEAAVGPSYFPERAVDYLRHEKGLRNLYDEYKWGGYCIYELYPRYRVFVDGRAEVYFGGALDDYFEIHYVRPNWRAALRRHHVDAALVDRRGTLYQVLAMEPGWRVAYSDEQAAVLVRSK